MAKLYFKYGAMGSSKTAQALITRFNYEERGMAVRFIKPKTDSRDGEGVAKSRIGLSIECISVDKYDSIISLLGIGGFDAVICDECQFLTAEQVDELRRIVDEFDIPVLCFGLRTDFMTHLFEGSKRLFEIADSISEIKTVCACGKKATVNARMTDDGRITVDGEQLMLGGNERYVAMCHRCWRERIKKES
ncbi:MAG: thymidine kinase [Clostridia bacterium]|nr:thymidine kinase [Clostridia bacterium]